jgi:hypothetical protein
MNEQLRKMRLLLGKLESVLTYKDLKDREYRVAQYHIQVANLECAMNEEIVLLESILNDNQR